MMGSVLAYIRRAVSALVIVGLGAGALQAERSCTKDLDRVVLEVRYDDGSGRAKQRLTLSDIMTLPTAGFETNTIWTDGPQTFEGVWLKDLFAHLDLKGGTVELSALNEYLVDFDAQDVEGSQALLAYRQNGEFLSPRTRGPLWVVFPYDHGTEFQTELTYAASIWQLDLMLALP